MEEPTIDRTDKVEVLALVQGGGPSVYPTWGTFSQEILGSQFENQWREGESVGFNI